MMRECWAFYPIVLYFPKKKARLRAAFSARIRWLRETGLMLWWLSDEIGAAARRTEGRRAALAENVRLGLREHLKGVFLTFLACLGVCVAVFSCEIVAARRKGQTDVYAMLVPKHENK